VVALQRAARRRPVGTIEYTEQLTYLLFLKMAYEREKRPLKPERIVPEHCSCQQLLDADGDDLENTYRHILERLGRQPGTLGVIFRKAQNRIQDPAKLKRLIVELIDKENWSATGTDVKGDAYEQLLSRGAENIKSGAGQYFTPRALTHAMVDCVQPSVRDTVVDPAAGTGGFLLAAHEYAPTAAETLTPTERQHLRDGFVHGVELVDGTARLAAMTAAARHRRAQRAEPHRGEGRPHRRPRPAVLRGAVQPAVRSQVLVDDGRRGRAGVTRRPGDRAEGLRRHDVQQAAELPAAHRHDPRHQRPGRRRAAGQRAVRRGSGGEAAPAAAARLRPAHDLDEFVKCYAPGTPHAERLETERFTSFTYDEVIARDKANLDISWLRDESLEDLDNLPTPEVIAREIVEDLTAALVEFEAVATALEAQSVVPPDLGGAP